MSTRTMTTLNIRGIERSAVDALKDAASARRLTLGQYLAKLATLHLAMRALADDGQRKVQAELEALGLETLRR